MASGAPFTARPFDSAGASRGKVPSTTAAAHRKAVAAAADAAAAAAAGAAAAAPQQSHAPQDQPQPPHLPTPDVQASSAAFFAAFAAPAPATYSASSSSSSSLSPLPPEIVGIVTASSNRRAKPDPAVDSGLLASPTLFAKAPARPRMLPVERRSWTYPGGSAAAAVASAVAAGVAPPPADEAAVAVAAASVAAAAAEAAAAAAAAGLPPPAPPPPVPPPPPLPAPPARAPQVERLDDYLDFVARSYYAAKELGAGSADFSLLRRTTLGLLTSPVREPLVLDRWAPLEIARFEAAICLVGKAFAQIAAAIGSKSTAEVVEFYYLWKQSKSYAVWRATYRRDEELQLD